MIVRQVLGAHALRKIAPNATAHIFRPDFIVALRERFGFVQVPVTPSEVLGDSLVFGYGKVEVGDKAILVKEFSVSPEWVALSVETSTWPGPSTEDAEIALKEIADWATEKFKIAPQPPQGAFASQLEVMLDFHFALAFPQLAQVGARLASSLVDSHGRPVAPFEVISIGMSVDPAIVQTPTNFVIERRARFPYEAADEDYSAEEADLVTY